MGIDLKCVTLSKCYGAVPALRDVSLTVREGSITAILGPSGSGKSTLLNVCAGVTSPTTGRVLLGDEDITFARIERRNIGVVFQSYALFPHLTVLDNVAFALTTKRHRAPREVARRRAQEMLDAVGLVGCENRRPSELSGGQQQRVALARALVHRPVLLLLDEPLGALDPGLKQQLLDDILRLRDRLGITIVYVTHDQIEAMSIADLVAVLNCGHLEQVASAETIYKRPANEFVARFVGEANLIRGRIERVGSATMSVDIGVGLVEVPRTTSGLVGKEVLLVIRPEAVRILDSELRHPPINRVSGCVQRVTFLGPCVRAEIDVAPGLCVRMHSRDCRLQRGEVASLFWDVSDVHVVDSVPNTEATNRRLQRHLGESFEMPSREALEEAR